MTQPGIELRSPGALANTLPTRPIYIRLDTQTWEMEMSWGKYDIDNCNHSDYFNWISKNLYLWEMTLKMENVFDWLCGETQGEILTSIVSESLSLTLHTWKLVEYF